MTESLKLLGFNIKLARQRRNLTLGEMALRSGVSRKTIGRLEQGDGSVSIQNMLAVLEILDLQDTLAHIANPEKDEIGSIMAGRTNMRRVRKGKSIS